MADEETGTAVSTDGADEDLLAVVGIGVGAASLPSLEQLVRLIEPGRGIAFLIAVHQDEAMQAETVSDVLRRAAPLPVVVAEDGATLRPDTIHVCGRNDILVLEGSYLRVKAADQPVAHRGTIDSLLISVAEQAHERAVAVILAHLGSEGTAGMTAIKKFGGLSIAETNGEEAGQGAIGPAPVADLHLPVPRIWSEIVRYADSLAESEASGDGGSAHERIEEHVKQINIALRNATSHDFHGYKRGTFIRRVQRRMQVLQLDGVEAYVARLRSDGQEVQNLFQDLLIGVTQFFRDPAEFDALQRELPRLFEGKGPDVSFRVWVLGCATGEEAYSIAILLREYMATLDRPPEVQIFATDLDARALGLARAGRYSDAIAQHVPPERLQRWFVREGNTYCVAKELREMCVFSPHNIVKDAPFSRVDILSCRNLLIYLNVELQNRVVPLFHFALRPGGLLFLGSSENVTRHARLFAPVDRRNRLFRKLETATRLIPDFPLTPRVRSTTLPEPGLPAAVGRLTQATSRQAEAVAERYAPAYVVVDAQGDVLHFSGRTGRYIEPAAGAPTLSLASLVHRDLRLDIRSALARAVGGAERVEVPRLTLRQDDRTFGVTVVVEPLGNGEAGAFVVLFQDLGLMGENGLPEGERPGTDEHVQRLEAELRVTRDRLQATVEEQESTNEELKSSNEEYQSINEEMQSANEELETSKEELQSVNEELQTVNGELAHRVSELGRINSDLKNLLESTQIATVFLDNDMRVRNFTPAATEIFHLLETDIGRPLDHVVSRVHYPELPDDVRRVLKTLVPVERQVEDPGGERRFAARVLPYRSIDNYISGVVVTFTSLTEVLRAQEALRVSEARFRTLFNAMDEGYLLADVVFEDGRPADIAYVEANPAAVRMMGTDPTGRRLTEIDPNYEAYWYEIWGRVALTGRAERAELYARSADTWYDFFVFKPEPEDAGSRRVALVFRDVGGRRQADEALRRSEERFRAFVTATSEVVYSMSPDWDEMLQLQGRDLLADTDVPSRDWMNTFIAAEDRSWVPAAIETAIAGRRVFALKHRVRRGDGSLGWISSRAAPIFDTDGAITEWIGAASDVTERHEAAAALQAIERRQQVLIEGVPQLVWRAVDSGEWTWASPQWSGFTGRAEAESRGRGWLDSVHPDDRATATAQWEGAGERGEFAAEYRLRHAADGRYRWFQSRATPVRDDGGGIVEWLGTSTDIDDLRVLQERQRVLVAELQHRTRNLIGVVRSLADRTLESAGSLAEFGERFGLRMGALARVQGLLSHLSAGERVTFGELVRSELAALGAEGQEGRIMLDGPEDVFLRSATVQTFALVLHELATNAVKYGALSLEAPGGRLLVTWQLDQADGRPDSLRVEWTESGVVMPEGGTPQGGGYGRELIERALPFQLGAETTYQLGGDGVRCTIVIPMAARERPGP